MKTENFNSFWKPSFIFLLICSFCIFVNAENDPNPDSPVPVLMNLQTDSTRVLAVSGDKLGTKTTQKSETVFFPGEGL